MDYSKQMNILSLIIIYGGLFQNLFLLLNIGNIRGDMYFKIAFKEKRKISNLFKCKKELLDLFKDKEKLKKELLDLFRAGIIIFLLGAYLIHDYKTYGLQLDKRGIIFISISILFIEINSIIFKKKYGVVTTKGLYGKDKFIKWKNLKNYKWISYNSIEITLDSIYTDEKYWKIEKFKDIIVNKCRVDEVFSKYLSKE